MLYIEDLERESGLYNYKPMMSEMGFDIQISPTLSITYSGDSIQALEEFTTIRQLALDKCAFLFVGLSRSSRSELADCTPLVAYTVMDWFY